LRITEGIDTLVAGQRLILARPVLARLHAVTARIGALLLAQLRDDGFIAFFRYGIDPRKRLAPPKASVVSRMAAGSDVSGMKRMVDLMAFRLAEVAP